MPFRVFPLALAHLAFGADRMVRQFYCNMKDVPLEAALIQNMHPFYGVHVFKKQKWLRS